MDVIKLLMNRRADINLQNKASNHFSLIVVAPICTSSIYPRVFIPGRVTCNHCRRRLLVSGSPAQAKVVEEAF